MLFCPFSIEGIAAIITQLEAMQRDLLRGDTNSFNARYERLNRLFYREEDIVLAWAIQEQYDLETAARDAVSLS
jgi:hypothetical protein